ncbi:NUDIX hydrolase [Gordonia effusa]|uniref:NUDIX hydrolase n=1 Tax=Gordonia effusa TaxID=263908 RepID=UPI001478CB5B|nr:CoA pyrophosphatase [Gordonia effusa]
MFRRQAISRLIGPPCGRIGKTLSGRRAAVAVVLSGTGPAAPGGFPSDASVLLIRRSAVVSHHRNEVAFPGGVIEPTDGSVVEAALREMVEETSVAAATVAPVVEFEERSLFPAPFRSTPVVFYRTDQSAITAGSAETDDVYDIRIADLADPANRGSIRVLAANAELYRLPYFTVGDVTVWGYTAVVLSAILDAMGWSPVPPATEVNIQVWNLRRLARTASEFSRV